MKKVTLNDDSGLFDKAEVTVKFEDGETVSTVDRQFSFFTYPLNDGSWAYMMNKGLTSVLDGEFTGTAQTEDQLKHTMMMMMLIKKQFPDIYLKIKHKYDPPLE